VLIVNELGEAAGGEEGFDRRTNFMANDSMEVLSCKVTVLENTAEMWARRDRWFAPRVWACWLRRSQQAPPLRR